MELYEEYEGRDDCLIQMTVNFGNIEKKFGPADTSKVSLSSLHCMKMRKTLELLILLRLVESKVYYLL